MTGDLLLRDVVVDGRLTDVLVRGGTIREMGPGLRPPADVDDLDGAGSALLPGLHDHHLHLFATAAARDSLAVGPAEVVDRHGFATALRTADATLPAGRWLRAVGYHESVAGPLDRHQLDALVPGRPVRVQHRSGALWVLSTAALDALTGVERDVPDGAERDDDGRLTGRFHRCDDWLRAHLPSAVPDLAGLGQELALLGITGVTDTTPYASLAELSTFAEAADALPQHVTATGGPALAAAPFPPSLRRGPVKLVLDEHDLPPFDELVDHVRLAHAHGRPVAVHSVTRATLALMLAVWDVAGAGPGDRVEHGSVIPPELAASVASLGLTVVTQPGFVAERGDEYRTDVEAQDRDHLYPCASLLAAGIEVAAGSDAPYTSIDPWAAMRAASTRATRSGHVLNAAEIVSPARALALYLGGADRPGGPPRQVALGAPADLCLLDGPLPTTVDDLRADRVVATIVAGRHHR